MPNEVCGKKFIQNCRVARASLGAKTILLPPIDDDTTTTHSPLPTLLSNFRSLLPRRSFPHSLSLLLSAGCFIYTPRDGFGKLPGALSIPGPNRHPYSNLGPHVLIFGTSCTPCPTYSSVASCGLGYAGSLLHFSFNDVGNVSRRHRPPHRSRPAGLISCAI